MTAVAEPPKTAQQANAEYNKKTAVKQKVFEAAKENASNAEITSVKYLAGKMFITRNELRNNADNKIETKSGDEPAQTFIDALNALAPHVVELVFTDKKEREYAVQRITIKGVNFKHHDEDNVHAGIVTTLTLKGGRETNLNIPQMPLYPKDSSVNGHTKEAAEAIEKVLEETREFLAGKRAQGTLFD